MVVACCILKVLREGYLKRIKNRKIQKNQEINYVVFHFLKFLPKFSLNCLGCIIDIVYCFL